VPVAGHADGVQLSLQPAQAASPATAQLSAPVQGSEDATVKFGLFYQLPCAADQSEFVRYQETIEQIALADQLGFDVAWLAELHFFKGFSIMPSPLMIAVAAAQRTRRIRLGTAVVLLPFHHPLRAAEDAAAADLLTGGRLEYGVGRGTIAVHFQGFGVPRDESRERFEEALEIILRAWTEERLSYKGRFFEVSDVALAPKPLQKPHPPLRIAANSPETAQFAGGKGYDVLVASPINPMPGVYDHIRVYRDALARGDHPERAGDVAALLFVNPQESSSAARSQAEHSLMHYFQSIVDQTIIGGRGQYEGSYTYLKQVRDRAKAITYETVEQTMAVYGPPEQCIARINEIYDRGRIDQLVCWFNAGGLISNRDVMATMERFATKVMPAVRGLGERQETRGADA
jgi:alkanesulfonate monooxygenase SsuD/methylene tetrahydromethanopterin reductase-like flavin-dependent oxidoreductase (luciferase family)